MTVQRAEAYIVDQLHLRSPYVVDKGCPIDCQFFLLDPNHLPDKRVICPESGPGTPPITTRR